MANFGDSSYHNDSNQTLLGALVTNNVYAWSASGTGRMDLSASTDVSFAYQAITNKEKQRILNPMAHLQLVVDVAAIRHAFSKGGARYVYSGHREKSAAFTNVKTQHYYDLSASELVQHAEANRRGTHGTKFSKFFIKPRLDDLKLKSFLASDPNMKTIDQSSDVSYSIMAYQNVEIATNENSGTHPRLSTATSNTDICFQVLDLSNANMDGSDGSFNVLAEFKLYSKFNDSNLESTIYWPQKFQDATDASSIDSSKTYSLNGVEVCIADKHLSKAVKDICSNFDISSGVGVVDCSYIVQVLHGDLNNMKFVNGLLTADSKVALDICANHRIVCVTDGQNNAAAATIATNLQKSGADDNIGLDISFTHYTFEKRTDLNDSNYVGNFIVPILGQANEGGGAQIIHIPDSVTNLKRDAVASLASNFTGLAELMGAVSVEVQDEISANELNYLATRNSEYVDSNTNDLFDGGNKGDVDGVYTISGDIFTNKLLGAMLGDGNGDPVKRPDHLHKIVYYKPYGEDASKAAVARDADAVLSHSAGSQWTGDETSFGGTYSDISGRIEELTPQESAFFYYYPWASTEMCSSGSVVVVTDASSNPFRQFQEEFLTGKGYNDDIDVSAISVSVPTIKGWLDASFGYQRQGIGTEDLSNTPIFEWYSLVDICANSNVNAPQRFDLSYVYQDLSNNVRGNKQLSPLDIVFPDISAGAADAVYDNDNPLDNDFVTLNFRVPLKFDDSSVQVRLDKVSNLNNGKIQLANESFDIESGFKASCHARAGSLVNVSTNVTELMNSYMPVIIRFSSWSSSNPVGGQYETLTETENLDDGL